MRMSYGWDGLQIEIPNDDFRPQRIHIISGLPLLQKPFTPHALRDSLEALLGSVPPLR